MTCLCHFIVLVPCMRNPLCDICCMSRNSAGNHALFYIVQVGQTEMFRGCYIAKEIRTACRCDCTADRGSDMVIAGENIRNKRTENIEWCIMTDTFLQFHIRFNFIHCHVSRAFYHDLYILFPCTFRQCTKLDQLRNLSCIGCVVNTAGAQRITKTDGNVIFGKNIQYFVIEFIEGIFPACHHHPCEKQRTAAGDDIHFSLVTHKCFYRTAVNTCVYRHKINALFGMGTNDFQKILRFDFKQVFFKISDRIIHRNSSDHSR